MMRLTAWISERAIALAGWFYLAIALLICFDIAARRLLGFSSEATVEISGYLLASGMTWGLAGTLLDRGHVRIDVLVQKFPVAVRAWLHLASLAALVVTSAFLAWGGCALAYDSWQLHATDLTTLRTPLALPQGLWAAGLALLMVSTLVLFVTALRQLGSGRVEEMDRMLMARTYKDEAAETLGALGAGSVPARGMP